MEKNPLSDRESEILQLVSQGKSNKQIASELFISVNTVKVHISNIFQKIQVRSRTEATLYAIEHGIRSSGQNLESTDGIVSTTSKEPLKENKMLRLTGFHFFLLFFAILIIGGLGYSFANRASQAEDNNLLSQINNNRWIIMEDLPTSTSYASSTTYNAQFFLIGGVTNGKLSAKVRMYDLQDEQWKDLRDKPTPVSNVTAAVIGEKIYVPGGITFENETASVMEVYDPRNDTWTESASLPTPLSDYALEVFEGKLYLFGGRNQSNYSDRVFSYDPVLNNWTEVSPLSQQRAYFDSAQWGGKIYLVGGFDGTENLSLVESYVPSRIDSGEKPVYQESSLPEPAFSCKAEQLVDTLFAVCPDSMMKLSPDGTSWITEVIPDEFLLGPGFASANFNNNLYIMGGNNLEGQSTSFFGKFQALYSIILPILNNE